ncbi:MAG: methyltransferase domain-containing protein [Alphaproteobacteria bacterium]|nr:methyltransferase domain-containing protein [Alphaproteobacteria bacterium]
MTEQDWNPEAYERFRGLRLRPAIDLLAQVPTVPDGDVVDLGCGAGVMGAALRQRFSRPVIGIDTSPAMLAKAEATGSYDRLIEADAASWQPDTPPTLIFSNAVCHWLADHDALFPRLLHLLAPGGTLAVQVPRQYAAPSHALLRDLAQEMFPDRFDFANWTAPVATAPVYMKMLTPFGEVSAWETEYCQRLAPSDTGHPVQAFTSSTAMRPFVEKLGPDELRRYQRAYDEALHAAYPLAEDGSAIMPFRRVFFVVTRP